MENRCRVALVLGFSIGTANIVGTTSLTTQLPSGITRLRSVPAESDLHRAVIESARAWRRAILARDAIRLTLMASPDQRDSLNTVFMNKRSWQYRYVFGDARHSLRIRLSPRDRVILFEHVDTRFLGNAGVIACYVTGVESASPWPLDDAALRESAVSRGVPCQWFRQENGEWLADIAELNY